MPAKSRVQQQKAGAELNRRRSGQARQAFKGMPTSEVKKIAGTKHKGLPRRAKK